MSPTAISSWFERFFDRLFVCRALLVERKGDIEVSGAEEISFLRRQTISLFVSLTGFVVVSSSGDYVEKEKSDLSEIVNQNIYCT